MTEKKLNTTIVQIETNNTRADFFCSLKLIVDVSAN